MHGRLLINCAGVNECSLGKRDHQKTKKSAETDEDYYNNYYFYNY